MEEQAVVNNPIQQPPVNPATPKSNYWLIAIIILAVLFVAGSVYALVLQSQKQISPPPPEPPLSPRITLQPSPTPDETANWKTYTSLKKTFSFKYPSEIVLYDKDDGSLLHIQFREKLPTGSPDGYELAPGYMIDFRTGKLGLKKLNQIVEEKTEKVKEYIIDQLTSIKIGDYLGYTYSAWTDGIKANYVYLPNGKGAYIEITYYINDKNNNGYQETINQILSTLKFTQ